MTTITVPKSLDSEDLVAVPKKTYHEFLTWQKKVKLAPAFKATAAEKRALARARKNFAKGNYMTLNEFRRAVGINNR